MSQRAQIVTFNLTCSEQRAWLVIEGDNQGPRVLEMFKGYTNRWTASEWLMPGKYRCRYYCGDDHNVVYHGPARSIGSVDEGMDGLVSIGFQRDEMTLQPMNILLVEDNATSLRAFETLLRSDGHIVHSAEGYQSALDLAKGVKVDLAICDINLWDGDGCDLLMELQKLQTMRAIAVTGYTLPEETEHYRDAGFDSVLRKPVDHSELAAAIARLTSTLSESLPVKPTVGS